MSISLRYLNITRCKKNLAMRLNNQARLCCPLDLLSVTNSSDCMKVWPKSLLYTRNSYSKRSCDLWILVFSKSWERHHLSLIHSSKLNHLNKSQIFKHFYVSFYEVKFENRRKLNAKLKAKVGDKILVFVLISFCPLTSGV